MNPEILINGQQIDVAIENERTVGDVLRAFEQECEKQNAAIVGIELDGEGIAADALDEALARPLENTARIALSTFTKDDIKAAFKSCADSFEHISKELQEVAVKFQVGKEKEAHELIALFAGTLETFCRSLRYASLFPDVLQEAGLDGSSAESFFLDFSSILADFEQAMQEGDTVTIGDLAEYELGPRLDSLITMTRQVL